MGVKDLWTILAPFGERKPLYELQGKRVAVDLSCWVCESQNVAEYQVQPRLYLRNLYFRTCYLLLMDVGVVFVLEGRAPELKYKTIAARNALQFKGAKPKTDKTQVGKDRSRFNHTLRLCEEMLKLMGVACVKGVGEAEALCAYLNEDGLVDGIISQDSDCFAYGAHTVYRNFSISHQGTHAAKGGSVDVFDITKANQGLNFGRNKIIALALLCGSDYCEGIHGIGKDSVLKLFNIVGESEILPRLRSWKAQPEIYEQMASNIVDKNICTSCGHPGKVQAHTKKGCQRCRLSQGCDSSKFKDKRLEIKNELNIRNKALSSDPNFPDETLINEFLSRKHSISNFNVDWRKPDLINFIKFTVKYLTWSEIYSFEKIFPILTRWQLMNYHQVEQETRATVTPKYIKKRRNPKGVASYEIVWLDKYEVFKDVIPEDQLEQYGDIEKLWSTIEPQNIVESAYPDLVKQFADSKKVKKGKKKKNAVEKLDNLMKNISIGEPKNKAVNLHTLDSFVKATPKMCPFDLDQSNFGDEDDLEVSDIVDNIISKTISFTLPENLTVKLNNECSFFVSELTENDLFEETFREYYDSSQE